MKDEVRKIAEENHLINAKRKDSQGICFLGKINYNDYIKNYLGEKEGEIIDFDTCTCIGKHKGYWFHTIGQRKGLGLSGGPWYVVGKDINKNVVFVSKNKNIKDTYTIILNNINWLTKNIIDNVDGEVCKVTFKIRHSPDHYTGTLMNINNVCYIMCDEPITVAPGQFCILYDKDYYHCYGCVEICI